MTARSLESHLATFPSKRLDVRWECWCGATLGFVAYTDTIIDKIEAAWHSPTATGLNISYRHRQCKINFATMEQSNVYTAAVRPIRRVGRRALYGRPRAVRWAVKHDTGVEELDDHCSAALETCLGSVTTFSHASVTPDGVYRLDRIEEPHGSIVGSINAAPVAFARRGKPGEVTLLPPSTVAVTTAAAQRDSIIEDETFALANARVIPRVPLAQRVQRKLSHPEFYYHTTKSIYTGEDTPAYPYEGSEFMVYPKQPPKGEPLRESITFAMLDHRTRGMSTVYRLGEKMLWHCGTDVSDFLQSKPKPNQEWRADVEETVCNSSQYVTHANKENRAFLVHDFFTEGECDYVMQSAAPHMTPLDQHFPQDYRQSDRAMIASRSMAQEIFHRILPHLGKREVGADVIPLCFGHLGTWFPHSCNEAIKVNRYRVGGQFAAHRDGPWIPWEDMASIYTLLVYLNDDYEGGETEFLDGPVNVRYGPAPNALVRPERGMALVFNHDAWHAGRPVIAGVKYVLRTEIIFVRPRGIFTKADRYLYATDSTYHQAMQLYEASHAASKRGDSKAFVELYQQVVAMQRDAKVKNLELLCGRTRGQRILPTIPDEVLSYIGSFLRDGDVAVLLRLNRASYYSLAHSDIWYHRYVALRATRDGSVTEAYLAGVDWMSEYQKLKEPREMSPVIVFFGGTRVHAAHSCAVQRSSFYWAGEEGFSCWSYGYAQYRTSTSPRDRLRSPQDFMETWNLLQMLPGCTPLRDVEPWHMCMLDSDRFRFTPVVDATTNPVATTIHTAAATPSLAAAEWCLIARALAGQVDLLYSIVTLVAHPAWYFYDGPAHDAVPREMWSVSRNKCNYDAPPSSREGHKTAYAEVPPVSVALPAAPLPSLERRDVFLAGALRDLFAASVAPAVAVLDPAECVAAGANVTDAVVVLVSQSFHPQRGGPHALRVTVACYVCLVQNGRLQGMPHAHFAESDTTSTAGREANEIMDGIDKGTETTVLSFPTLREDEYLTKNNTHAVVVAYLDVPLERLSTPGDDLQIDLDLETTSQALTDAEIVALKSALLQPAARDRTAIPPDVKLAAERERRRRQRTMFKFEDPPKMDFVAAPAAVPEFLVLLENLCGVRAQYDSKFVVKGAAKLATSPLFRRDETRVYYRPDWRRSVHHNCAASPQPSTDAAAA